MSADDRPEDGAAGPRPVVPDSPGRALSQAEIAQRRVAARKHGLFAKVGPNLRGRSYRVGRLVKRAYAELPDLDARDLAVVRAWARAECRAVDCYARLEQDPTNGKLAEQWNSAENTAARRRAELFLTPASRLSAALVASTLRSSPADVQKAQARLRERVAAGNAQVEALSASEAPG